jgi:hypothetical protein
LTLTADQYEAVIHTTPRITEGKDFGPVVLKAKRKPVQIDAGKVKRGEGFRGKATHQGKPVTVGCVTLDERPRPMNVVNGYILRGRVTTAPRTASVTAVVENGQYELTAWRPGSYTLTLHVTGQAPTATDVLVLKSGDWRTQDLSVVECGSLRGKVAGEVKWPAGTLWVVAFDKSGFRAETPVEADGTFVFQQLPPGEYGVKVGHDAVQDQDAQMRAPQEGASKTEWDEYIKRSEAPSDPWNRAKVVKVESGKAVEGVMLELPAEMLGKVGK